MLDYTTRYPGQIDTSDPTGYPQGKAKNISVPGDGTGTPWERDIVNDLLLGPAQALVDHTNVTPDGNVEKVGASQLVTALRRLADQQLIHSWGDVADFANSVGAPRGGDYWENGHRWILAGGTDTAEVSLSDGKVWQDFSTGMGSTVALQDVAIDQDNDIAIAVGNSATIYRITDIPAGTWSTATLAGSPTQIASAAWDPVHGVFVVVGNTASGAYIATSADGSSWTERTAPASFTSLNLGGLAVSQDDGVMVAGATTSTNKIARSADGGVTWADATTTLGLTKKLHFAYNTDLKLFIAMSTDGIPWTSTDGNTWTIQNPSALGFPSSTHFHTIVPWGHLWLWLVRAFEGAPTNATSGIAISYDGGQTFTDFVPLTRDGDEALISDRFGNMAIASLNIPGLAPDAVGSMASPRRRAT